MSYHYTSIPKAILNKVKHSSFDVNTIYLLGWLNRNKVPNNKFLNGDSGWNTTVNIDLIHHLCFEFTSGETRNKRVIKDMLIELYNEGDIKNLSSDEIGENLKYNEGLVLNFTYAENENENENKCYDIDTVIFDKLNNPNELFNFVVKKYNIRFDRKNRVISGYENWRISVLANDNYTCQICNASSLDQSDILLHAHHKDGYEWCIERRTDISNGATLCDSCHTEFHVLYGYGGNTEQQYIEFYESKIHDKM